MANKWPGGGDVKIMNHAGEESPKVVRKRFGSEVSDEHLTRPHVNGVNNDDHSSVLSPDLELLKQEILKEVRRDLAKMKQEILEGESCSFYTIFSTPLLLLMTAPSIAMLLLSYMGRLFKLGICSTE